MQIVELKITLKDWIYIIIIGAFFGFFISLFFYFLNKDLQNLNTIFFSTISAFFISLFAFFLITISNKFILPKMNKKFWYLISFIFSFLAGFLGFSFSFFIFSNSEYKIIELITSFWLNISITIGFLTFLVGLILHQFISMKYKNEEIKTEILETKLRALENELNPHFLFNALNSVSELIYQDQKKAENAVIDISKFLRNAINKESLITLESELSMVKTYVNIENIRFDEQIVLYISDFEKIKSIKVPKFSVQLLVENAIKHGFLGKKLEIYIKFENNNIIVLNNGKLTENLKFGTGLSNLERRLVLQKIGKLKFQIEENMMKFIIILKD